MGSGCTGKIVITKKLRSFAPPSVLPDIDMTGKERTPIAGEIPNPVNPPPGCHFHPRCPLRFEPCDKVRPLLKPYGQNWAACHALEEGRAEQDTKSGLA
jgi:peptide/nickel transport system ATP-binding protein